MPPDPPTALRAAIHGLYQAFGSYHVSDHVDGCPCCTSPEDNRRVQSRPLRQLGPADLERFAFKAITTLGTVDDFKHFLPRLLELAALEGEVGDTPLEVVLGKLRYGKWNSWPRAERVAIDNYLTALWAHVLAAFPCKPEVDDSLCAIGRVLDDLSPFLQSWRADESAPAARHLADFIDVNFNQLSGTGTLQNAFWQELGEQMQSAVDWLMQPQTADAMERAFFRYSTEPFAGDLSLAVERLVWLRQSR
jgi:hypothetical protein